MTTHANAHDVRAERYKFLGLMLTVIAGPVIAFYLAAGKSDANHAQSAKGYEVLASLVNPHEARLDALELKVARLQGPAGPAGAASQPVCVAPVARELPAASAAVTTAKPLKPARLVVVGVSVKPAAAVQWQAPRRLVDVR